MRPAIALAVIAVVATSCKQHVDTQDFESRIRARVAELGLPPSAVTCPKDVEVRPGVTFACDVVIADKSYELDATIDDATAASGNTAEINMSTKWKRGDAVVAAKLAPALAAAMTKSIGVQVAVSCGEPLRFLDADRTVRCDLTAGNTKSALITTFDANVDPTDWKLDPPALVKHTLEGILTPAVRDKTAADATVTCGDEPLILRPATGIVTCAVGVGGKHAKLAVTVDDKLEVTRWEIVE